MLRSFATAVVLLASSAWADVSVAASAQPAGTVWKASVQAGAVASTGNSQSTSLTAGGSVSMNDKKNRVALDANVAYVNSAVLTLTPTGGTTTIGPGDFTRVPTTTTELWAAKLRYDRFLTPAFTGFVAGVGSANVPAGINLAAGAQAGVSYRTFQTAAHVLRLELGYDYTYQDNVTPAGAPPAPTLNIHSLRGFVGYDQTFSKEVGFTIGLEALENLNALPNFAPNAPEVGPFNDFRLNGTVSLTAQLWKDLSFKASFLAKYTTNPALLNVTLPAGDTYIAGYVPRAERLDTVTTVALVLTLL
jgi:hypothetical protein